MAYDTPNIKSFSNHLIVVGSDGIENGAVTEGKLATHAVTANKLADGSVTNVKLINGAIDASKMIDGAVTTAKIADSAVIGDKINDGAVRPEKLSDVVKKDVSSFSRDMAQSVGETSLSAYAWVNGIVQTNSSTSQFGQIVASTKAIVTKDRLYAEKDVQVWADDGWNVSLYPYSSDSDSAFLYGQESWCTYAILMWHPILHVPAGCYYRISCRQGTGSNDVTINQAMQHVHIVTNAKAAIESGNLAPALMWQVGELSSFIPNWSKSTHLLMADIVTAEQPIKIIADDSIVRPYIVYHDAEGNPLNAASSRATSIPKGARFRLDLNIRDGKSQGHYEMVQALRLVPMDGNFIWYGTSGGSYVNYSASRIIMCMPEVHDYPVVVSLTDYSKYRIGTYLKGNGDVVSAFDYEALYDSPVGVPAGQWYHVYLGKVGDTEFTRDEVEEAASMVRVEPLAGYAPSIDGIRYDLAALKQRVAELEGDELPSYYSDYMDGKIADILELNPKQTENVLQFAFVTDFHANVYSQTFKTRMLLSRIFAETNCSMFVNGGDTLNGKLSDGTAVASIDYARQMRRWSSWLVPDESRLSLMVAGNHDAGVDFNPNTPARIDEQTLFEQSALSLTAGNVVVDPCSKCSYYLDDPYHSVRWIVGNVGNTANIGKWSSATLGVTGESKADAVSFVGASLKSMPAGWTAIVFNHILVQSWPNGPTYGAVALEQVCDAYNARTTATIEGRLFNFTDGVGEVACIIGGHLHVDYSYVTAGGTRCIVTTTDNRGGQCKVNESDKLVFDSTGRDAGTVTEHAFDIFTIDLEDRSISTVRIGFGADRSWTY